MTEICAYYFDDPRYMMPGTQPATQAEFERDYRRVFREVSDVTSTDQAILDRMFRMLNINEENPLADADEQAGLARIMVHPHTSLSVGDVVTVDGRVYICKAQGWGRLELQ